ncbi:unnamed protein product [Rotaria sordida]|uniref:Uncharacterized protein n=1 Tax=Rotaria sordida TaxID=392033 RepID=A0A819ZIX2_9BILA|nr:unnamed protein product [Rotaria sordida]CAF4170642.1 unnamed protein product [Rotaria sordida]
MASTVDKFTLSTSNSVQNVQSEEQTTKNDVCTEPPPPYESCVNNANTSLEVHYQSRLGSRNNDECTQAFVEARSPPTQSIDQIETYIVWSIFNILCCCLCFGCLACCYGNKTQQLKERNDVQGALKASKQARTWNTIATIFGICELIIGVLITISKQQF